MKIKLVKAHRDEQGVLLEAVFGVDDNSELIVIDVKNISDRELRYKKNLIAEHLDMIAYDGKETNWCEIDKLIKSIMRTKIHFI